MAKKKKKAAQEDAPPPPLAATPSSTNNNTNNTNKNKSKKADVVDPWTKLSSGALIICRNKHWRYISCFHGPWLQLPPSVLDSLAHSNYLSPRPHPIDPAVFFDLVKIRRLVDDSTELAVRASTGLSTTALNNTSNAYGNSADAEALGLGGYRPGGGGGAKLSRERKHRMRETASRKLSAAYHLDEIATSVATMQGATTLEEVAHLVLQRSRDDYDARYVHFFHEKIPSRMMAQCTPLDALDRLIAERGGVDAGPWRTRALTRLFKEDWEGAARDLTEALAVVRIRNAQHGKGRESQLVLASLAREEAEKMGRGEAARLEEEDQPSSMEAQLLFHRAGVYLTIACRFVDEALNGLKEYEEWRRALKEEWLADGGKEEALPPPDERNALAQKRRLEARKMVKTNAKRALRDYTMFLGHFDYSPGLPQEITEEFIKRVNTAANGLKAPKRTTATRSIEGGSSSVSVDSQSGNGTSSLVPFTKRNASSADTPPHSAPWPSIPLPQVYQVSSLFSPTPPPNLPPFPPCTPRLPVPTTSLPSSHEAVTYHPLLTDALHSLLLAHCLMQTSPTELLRHAHNAARLARVCDGYPLFLAARSPARADWVEVLRRARNWIGLVGSWDGLCRPVPLTQPQDKNAAPANGERDEDANAKAIKDADADAAGAGADAEERMLKTKFHGASGRTWEQEQQRQQRVRDFVDAMERDQSEAQTQHELDARWEEEQLVVQQKAEREKAKKEKERQRKKEQERARKAAEREVRMKLEEAVVEALADEKVVDDESFARSVGARRMRMEEDARAEEQEEAKENEKVQLAIADGDGVALASLTLEARVAESDAKAPPPPSPPPPAASSSGAKRWAQDEGKEYVISTERAEAIARWVREAPLTIEGAKKGTGAKKKKAGVRRPKPAPLSSAADQIGERVRELGVDEDDEDDGGLE